MKKEEILEKIDEAIAEISIQEAIEWLADLAFDIEIRQEGLRDDIQAAKRVKE
jgi:hypothetical protein